MHEEKRHLKRAADGTQGSGKRTARKSKRDGKSIRWMVTALLVAVGFMGWAIAAASYASDAEEFRPPGMPVGGRGAARGGAIILLVGGLVRFLWNAVVQIPSAHRVASHTITRHPVLLLLTALAAVGVGLVGWWMSRLEHQFARQDERFRRMSGND